VSGCSAWIALTVSPLAELGGELRRNQHRMPRGAVFHAADLVEESGATDHIGARAGFGGDVTAQVNHLADVLKQVVTVVMAELQAADQARQARVKLGHAQRERGLRSGFLDQRLEFFPDLDDDFLDARGWMRPSSTNRWIAMRATSRRAGSNDERRIAPGVSSMMTSMPVAISRARMLRPRGR
jgi:hypothetical protein